MRLTILRRKPLSRHLVFDDAVISTSHVTSEPLLLDLGDVGELIPSLKLMLKY